MWMRIAVVLASLLGLVASAACGARTELDVPPPVVIPPIDASVGPGLSDCPDAGATLVYVVTQSSTLYSFDPPTATFKTLGGLACPTPNPEWQPFSMAVNRKGTAYVLFSNYDESGVGQLYQVDPATSACTALPYVGGQLGFNTFGMGFVGDGDHTTDTLYIADDTSGAAGVPQLATLDLSTFHVSLVGNLSPGTIQNAELSGSGDGRLFAFYAINQGTSSAVGQLDPATGALIANDDLVSLPQVVNDGGGWAFGYWGGEFYLFTTSPTLGSLVTRFNPSDKTQTLIATLPEIVVGAGVSTCAPQ